jgi:hypothetical protein
MSPQLGSRFVLLLFPDRIAGRMDADDLVSDIEVEDLRAHIAADRTGFS